MNRKELVEKVAAEHELSFAAADRIVRTVFDSIQTAVKKGEGFTLIGFGSFSSKKRAARTTRNPATGGTVKVPAKTVPTFKAGATFKALVAGKAAAKKPAAKAAPAPKKAKAAAAKKK